MMDGFNLDSPLVCEGIIGDGCGGGRIFFINDSSLCAYDPISKDNIVILENIKIPLSISKKGCIISLTYKDSIVKFDLSTL